MRVKCKFNNINDIKDAGVRERLSESIHRDSSDDDLIVGKVYVVVAIARWNDGGLWIYLHTVKESDYPYPYPLEMFEVVDAAVPGNWHISFFSQPERVEIKMMSFAEWTTDSLFYEKLVDGDERAITLYKNQCHDI